MKQLIIAGTGALATTPATLGAMAAGSKIGAGLVALYDSKGAIVTAANAKDVDKRSYLSLFVGATEATEMMESVGMIELQDFSYVKGDYIAGTKFSSSVTIPNPVVGEDYTILLARRGTVPNERDQWSSTTRVKAGDTAATIAAYLAKEMKAKGSTVGLTAIAEGAKISVSSTITGEDWKLVPSDDLHGNAVTDVVRGILASNDAAYIKDLYRQCIGNRGIYGTDPAGMILHKDPAISGNYTLYTFAFYNRRHDKTTSSEDVRQVVHLAIPAGSASIATLDTILKAVTGVVVIP